MIVYRYFVFFFCDSIFEVIVKDYLVEKMDNIFVFVVAGVVLDSWLES